MNRIMKKNGNMEMSRRASLVGAGLLVAGLMAGPAAGEESKAPARCPGNVTHSMGALKSNIGSRLRANVSQIREALAAQGVPINVYVTVKVDTMGIATIMGSSATCGGKRCPKVAQPHKVAGISSKGLPPVSSPDVTCAYTFVATLPSG